MIKPAPSGDVVKCLIENISVRGAKLRLPDDVPVPNSFLLMLPLIADVWEEKLVELRWRIGTAVGVRFC